MSLIQSHKCADIRCSNNALNQRPTNPRTKDRFCFQCLKRSGMGGTLEWQCRRCSKRISGGNTTVIYCAGCGLENRRQYHRKYYQDVRKKTILHKCVWCGKKTKSKYCTSYCKWINGLKNNNYYKFSKILRLIS